MDYVGISKCTQYQTFVENMYNFSWDQLTISINDVERISTRDIIQGWVELNMISDFVG